jgi:hypothetical protein
MFINSASAGAVCGNAVGNTPVTAHSAAKAAVLGGVSFIRGFKAGWCHATSTTHEERRAAQARLPAPGLNGGSMS